MSMTEAEARELVEARESLRWALPLVEAAAAGPCWSYGRGRWLCGSCGARAQYEKEDLQHLDCPYALALERAYPEEA